MHKHQKGSERAPTRAKLNQVDTFSPPCALPLLFVPPVVTALGGVCLLNLDQIDFQDFTTRKGAQCEG